MRHLCWMLVVAGCAELEGLDTPEDAARSVMRGRDACKPPNGKESLNLRLQNACIDEACSHIRVELAPAGYGGDWFIDGRLVAEHACSIDVELPPHGKPRHIMVDTGPVELQEVMSSSEHADPGEEGDGQSSGPSADIIISGDGDDCNFWILGLGGCLTQTPQLVYRSKFFDGTTTTTEYVAYDTNPRYPVVRDYGSYFAWTPDGNAGMIGSYAPPMHLDPGEVGVEHWFGLAQGETRMVWALHGLSDPAPEFVNSFACGESGGEIGGGP